MTYASFCCASLLTLAATLAVRPAPVARTQDAEPGTHVRPEQVLAEMDWLAGTWSGDMWGGRFVAFYSTPAGGKILSHSVLVKDGQEAFYEFEVFEAKDQLVHLQPFPGGKRATGFRLSSHDPTAHKAVFENPDKDFPTRITYERVADDRLEIVLSDPHGGSDKVERFELSRPAEGR